MPHVELLLPGGSRMTASLPLNQHMQKQLSNGTLRYAEAAVSPDVALDGEVGVSRVEAPAPAVLSQPGEPENPGQPVEGAEDIPPPAGNATREEWAAYAVSQGLHPDEAAQLKREEIKARIVGTDTPVEG
jgi:hypothetical protein